MPSTFPSKNMERVGVLKGKEKNKEAPKREPEEHLKQSAALEQKYRADRSEGDKIYENKGEVKRKIGRIRQTEGENSPASVSVS